MAGDQHGDQLVADLLVAQLGLQQPADTPGVPDAEDQASTPDSRQVVDALAALSGLIA
ncbi:hypothetical protein [Nonomuraea basaltis]|uniref:hypothetical protein n=1 Tax=Nonomuraea basaltis TaxID=2495887 RepID=UPI00148620BA|nr:hypothetical protein [Nonomuraea basaltis]